MAEKAIPKAAYASFRKTRKHPQIIIKFRNAKPKAITLPEFINGNAEHEKIVRQRVDQINQKIGLGVYDFLADAPTKTITLKQFARRYLEHRAQLAAAGELGNRTVINDREALRYFVEIVGANVQVGKVDRAKIQHFARAFKMLPMKSRAGVRKNESVNQKLRALSAAFTWATEEQIILFNPFRGVPKLPEKNPRENINVYLPSQLDRFREFFKDKPPAHGAAFEFALATMARAGGIAALNESDIFTEIVDDEPAHLAILREKGKHGKPKNRIVFLDHNARYAIDIMRSWYNRVEEYCDRYMIAKNPGEYVARVQAGKVFFPFTDYHSISQMFRKARRALGIPGKFHDLRKTASTAALDQGVSRRIIQEQLGHSDGKVTDNHYLKVSITALVREMRSKGR